MSYRSSNRYSPGFGAIKIDSNQNVDSFKPEFSNRGIFDVATSYGGNVTFSSLTEVQSAGYQELAENDISGSSLITNNGDGTYTVASNKITINHKSMFCLKPNVRYNSIGTSNIKSFVIGNATGTHDELNCIISAAWYKDNRPTGAEDCYSFSTSFWPTPVQHSFSQSFINNASYGYVNRYNQEIIATTDNFLIIWRLL
jgi:hypothetical protein